MTAWTDLVKKVWNENKKKVGFKFKDALMLAKKQYKGALTKKRGGSGCGAMSAEKVMGGSKKEKKIEIINTNTKI
mgnify:CR=1 FL=1